MRAAIATAAAALVSISAPAGAGERMRGFDELAARSERLDITGLLGWHKGKFRLGDTGQGGSYAIVSSHASGYGESVRSGGSSFELAGPGIGGNYTGRCRFEMVRAYDRMRNGKLKLTVSVPILPLGYHCEFAHDGEPIGSLDLAEIAARGIGVKQEFAGRIAFGGQLLDIRSVHHFEKGKSPAASPLGYVIETDGRAIGAADLNDTRKRLALPNDPALREATLLASIALALFWNPGDDD